MRDAGGGKSSTSTGEPSSEAGESKAPPACTPVRSLQPLPARLAAMSSSSPKTTQEVFVADLFGRFNSACGGCHVIGDQGGFKVTASDFATQVGETVLQRVETSDATKTMPPISSGGMLFASRSSDDAVRQLDTLLRAWVNAGRPSDVFEIPVTSTGSDVYQLSTAAGDGMTNLGNCIPNASLFGSEPEAIAERDRYFASLQKKPAQQGSAAERIGLPESLSDTDLVSFDSEVLARYGVVAYAPTYPLWSDGSGKIRYVRVPSGTSIHFDKATQTFDLPENTRFYKTFLKPVVELDGSTRWRKMETRVIVVRHDARDSSGSYQTGADAVRSLFGTYRWEEDESRATLVTDTLRNGEPFTDIEETYPVDYVAKAAADAELDAAQTAGNAKSTTYVYSQHKVLRHYAIPGSQRCIDCHMGSPTYSFVLGAQPLQLVRRPLGEGGVIEDAGDDELTQLARFIEYGIVTGVSSSADITPLEKSQGTRGPRNDHELVAQGYLLGNCSHCHNPRGLPSVENPVLATDLNFLPSADGGVFQFPLERTSRRIFRGLGGKVAIPYLTPSLIDRPSGDVGSFYTPKYGGSYPILAPWRSLIYRNVDTPFTYSDDLALFPHMPMDSAGFDCRAPVLLANWMVSIPAVRVNPDTQEYPGLEDLSAAGAALDSSEQPYKEVKPSDPSYAEAVKAAERRLSAYHTGTVPYGSPPGFTPRAAFCPDTSDIVDPAVLADPEGHPAPTDNSYGIISGTPSVLVMPSDGVPDRAHWVITDLTEPRTDSWTPRREDWPKVLTCEQLPAPTSTGAQLTDDLAKQAKQLEVVQMLVGEIGAPVTLTSEIREYAATLLPFGLWEKKDTCNFSKIPTVSSFGASGSSTRPQWMSVVKPKPADTDPVYQVTPGGAVFGMICTNCHGAKADSDGRQAKNLNMLSGGNAVVANLRDGLFGPSGAPGTGLLKAFSVSTLQQGLLDDKGQSCAAQDVVHARGGDATSGVTEEDRAARYMAWMALGGTKVTIPPSILAIVGNTEVLGVPRPWATAPVDANMLSTAQNLCKESLPIEPNPSLVSEFTFDPALGGASDTALIRENGDADLWQRLCSLNNPAPVRAVVRRSDGRFILRGRYDFYPRDSYPADAPVGNDRGGVDVGIQSTNPVPWCLRRPASASALATLQEFTNNSANVLADGNSMPLCPESIVPPTDDVPLEGDGHMSIDTLQRWGTRGAINAGLLVFLYLENVTQGKLTPVPRYDSCETLAP